MAKKSYGQMTFHGDRFELQVENGIRVIMRAHVSADMAVKYFNRRGFMVTNEGLFQTPKRRLPKW